MNNEIEMDDEENIKLIKQALECYEEGAFVEAKVALITVVNRIEAYEIAIDLVS